MRTKKKDKKSGNLFITVFKNLIFIALAGVLVLTLLFYSVAIGLWGALPSDDDLINIKHDEASTVWSSDGEILGKYYIENRSSISFNNISPNAINALIATEDVRFYQHEGVDRMSLMRVLFKTILLRNKNAGGGSTISQQLAKNLFPRDEQSVKLMPIIKLKEMIVASRLEELYNKQEILTLYLNTVSFGEELYGIESAAQHYFSTSAPELSMPQAATLIGMLKGPSYYNPRLHPERALTRRNVVLKQMEKYEYLTAEQYEQYQQETLGLKYAPYAHYAGLAPYFRQQVKNDVIKLISNYNTEHGTNYNLYTDGLKIVTTLNAQIQGYAENAVKSHIITLQKQLNEEWNTKKPWDGNKDLLDKTIKQSGHYNRLKNQGMSHSDIMKVLNEKREMFVFDPVEGEKKVNFSAIDSIKYNLMLLHPAAMAVNPKSGAVLAWVGGSNYKYFQYDQIKAERQVGSVFKPVVYSAAVLNGAQTDAYFPNKQTTYTEYDNWTPRNSDNNYEGFYTLKGALAKSVNTIAVEVLMETGIDNVINHAQKLGIQSKLPAYPSLALGVANLSLQEMLNPYMVYANGGRKVEQFYLLSIETKDGEMIYKHTDASYIENVMSSELCSVMNDMLMATVEQGTANGVKSRYGITTPLAAKTGTTQNHVDGWFIGYTPHLVMGVRVGADNPGIHFRSIRYGQGANMSLPIFASTMRNILSSKEFRHWNGASFPFYINVTNTTEQLPIYKEKLNLIERITNNKFDEPIIEKQDEKQDKPKFLRKIGRIFKAKKK
ncbi:MAG: transglycosylase domain-containing protein [Marinifilaceae bacterium]